VFSWSRGRVVVLEILSVVGIKIFPIERDIVGISHSRGGCSRGYFSDRVGRC